MAKGILHCRINTLLKEALKKQADENDTTTTELLECILYEALKEKVPVRLYEMEVPYLLGKVEDLETAVDELRHELEDLRNGQHVQ